MQRKRGLVAAWNLGVAAVLGGLAGLGMGGCQAPAPPLSVANPDPTVKIPAIKAAVRHDDLSAAPQMVQDLDSDDAAVRLFAIYGLRRLAGQDFGYRFYFDEQERRPFVQKWRQWLVEKGLTPVPGK
jgi:hypothetical protein